MALQDIIDKIKNDAQAQAEKLKAENGEKITGINAQADKEIKAIEKKTDLLTKKKYDQELRLKISLATLEQKNLLLAAKQSLIDEVFEKALAQIKALPADKYKELLINAILKVDAHGNEGIILGEHDHNKLGADLVKDINAAFSKSGGSGNFKLLSERRAGISGCVLKDGRKETICTFEAIIAGKRKELEREIAKLIFKAS